MRTDLVNNGYKKKISQYDVFSKIRFRVVTQENIRDKYKITVPKHTTTSYEKLFSYQIQRFSNCGSRPPGRRHRRPNK